jgi:hypothetical protein
MLAGWIPPSAARIPTNAILEIARVLSLLSIGFSLLFFNNAISIFH